MLFGELTVHIVGPYFHRIFVLMSPKCFYIFQVQICFKIFDLHTVSAFCGLILHLLLFFEIQFLNVGGVKFIYIFFFPYVFGCISKEPLPNLRSQVVMPVSLVAQRLKRLPAMRETWVRSLGQEDPLEKEMATHSSILAWRIPWTEEPGGLQSTGSQRVGHD